MTAKELADFCTRDGRPPDAKVFVLGQSGVMSSATALYYDMEDGRLIVAVRPWLHYEEPQVDEEAAP